MAQKDQPVKLPAQRKAVNYAAVLRAVWLLLFLVVIGLVFLAVPSRYQMLAADVYGFGEGLVEIGVSLPFFAVYFIFWELVLVTGSLLVAGVIGWRKADEPFALLVAILLTLLGCLLPLFDGLPWLNPLWLWPILAFRFLAMVCMMAVICLFPNGRFQPQWVRWIFVGWVLTLSIGHLIKPDLLADTAVLPNTRSLADASPIFVAVAWFLVAFIGQSVRYRRLSNSEERQQIRWVLLGALTTVLFSLISALLLITVPLFRDDARGEALFILIMGPLYLLSALLLPTSIALAMLRYRLWKVDFYINRTLVYGGLTVTVTAVYFLLVGGVGTLAVTEQSTLVSFAVATAVVLVGIRPLHRQLQEQVDQRLPLPSTVHAPKASDSKDPRFLRAAWIVNALLALTLFIVGMTTQLKHGFWQPPPIQPTSTVPLLAGGLLPNALVPSGSLYPFVLIPAYVQAVVFVAVGLLLFVRKSRDVMGILASWMLIAVGLGFSPTIFFLPLLEPAWHIPVSLFQAGLFVSIFLFLCLFPNGRFFPRWSRYAALAWLAFTLLWLPFPQLNLHRATTIWPPLIFVGVVFLGISFQIVRYRRLSEPDEKQQTKWVIAGFAAANCGLFGVVLLVSLGIIQSTVYAGLAMLLLGMASIFIPLTISVALFRYRLWDIDIIINRTLVYGGLSLGIVAVYVLVVGALGTLFQSQGNVFFALLATGLIAVLFQPVHKRLQRRINRLMFGERDDPYTVLSKLGAQLQTTATPQATLQSVVETIAASLKLPYVAIELTGENERLEAAKIGKMIGDKVELPLRYQNETIGYLIVSSRSPGESFSEREQRLLADIAAQAGAVASSARLMAALQRSREKLVLTREEERRRIRRDLHDGLGPTLASQTFTMDAILQRLETKPQEAAELLIDLKAQNKETVAEIRRLVYELRPPVLDDLGLLDALLAHAAQFNTPQSLQITISADPDPLPALSAAVEVAAYRIVLEAITNVIRHASARHCRVHLQISENGRSTLQIEVSDDGQGLPGKIDAGVGLHSISERAEELGGSLIIENLAAGTQLTARLPLA